MIFLIILIFLITNSFANEASGIKNLIIIKELKRYDNLVLLDANKKQIDLNNYRGNLILLNFWATWCAPCKDEMPSLNFLQKNDKLSNLKIFPINVGQEKVEKAKKFFRDLEINNLGLYFDNQMNLAKKFSLRGIPTSIFLNKEGEEFARVIGSTDFQNKEFLDWLSSFN